MRRTVSATLDLAISDPAEIALQITAAAGERLDEKLDVQLDGAPVTWQAVEGAHGGRAHLVRVERGQLAVRYTATVIGRAAPPACGDDERLVYLRPSRYAESDRLAEFGRRQFGGLTDPAEILGAVSSWVGWELGYESGWSLPTHGAVDTLLGGRGVCRDFAHLVVALLRARDVPARVAAVYAPGLQPMDFHAVAEALVDGTWRVVDATLLAPRSSLVRIATGRDAADTAFLTVIGGTVDLVGLEVSAVVEGNLPTDDPRELVSLG
jgi:transglutaminase-like putative cysteine protease